MKEGKIKIKPKTKYYAILNKNKQVHILNLYVNTVSIIFKTLPMNYEEK